jgi:hypothetical protein
VKRIIAIVLLTSLAMPLASQSSLPIQGVWRVVARTIPAAVKPGDRVDPFAHVPEGRQTDVQPGLLIFTTKHYSRTTDTAVQPRPTGSEAVPGKPTVDELQSRWGPFQANAGTYELSGNTLTLRLLVSKNPGDQRGNFARLTVKMDGDRLWLTPIENASGRIVAGVTSEYIRVE